MSQGSHYRKLEQTTEAPNFGYSYQTPASGWNVKIRNCLSQCSDLFSEFNKYIAPAYHHDRCERSVDMRLYSMHKREFVVVYIAFFACMTLVTFIGLAGPPMTTITDEKSHSNESEIATGPFILETPRLTGYSRQLWVISKLSTSNNDDERYDQTFQVSVCIDGITSKRQLVPILSAKEARNRTRHLKCEERTCKDVTVAHLGFIEFVYYTITVRFYGLETFHQRYTIRDLTFYFKHYNPAFTQLEIWFRLVFLIMSFFAACWFGYSLRTYPVAIWSIEQKWIMLLLLLLMLYNNPFFPSVFLINSWIPGMTDAFLQTTFLCAILMFWLCIYHGLRQTARRFFNFYLPKLIVVGSLWLCGLIFASWLRRTELEDPTYTHDIDSPSFYELKIFFFTASIVYVLYLVLLVLRAYTELRSMPFFEARLRFLTLFVIIVAGITASLSKRQFMAGILEDDFISRLSTQYRTSAQFLALYGLFNFYLFTMAYVYSPSSPTIYGQHSTIAKENTSLSIVNDSDEDVLYGSDEESRKPLTRNLINVDDSD